MVDTKDGDLGATFRAKSSYMKGWKPASTPSNRDRLELYALHKQALSGDAPATFPTSASSPDKAKYQAWRAKNGLSQSEAMRMYIQECDRQVRVYGSTATQTPQPTPASGNAGTTTTTGSGASSSSSSSNTGNSPTIPRGLAAIPLLCAAASESRGAYIRRLAQTPSDAGWWARQESLCASPGTLGALPESLVLQLARLAEQISLGQSNKEISSFFWPWHNCCLSVWMLVIILYTMITSGWSMLQTIVWGARRTGTSLQVVWKDQVSLAGQSVSGMCESHQALSCRLVGLALLPLATISGILNKFVSSLALSCTLYLFGLFLTWWYWIFVLPWVTFALLSAAIASGFCFFVIELAGV